MVAQGVFSGNSGVVSFGHVSFVALGAFGAGIMSLASTQKAAVFPALFGFIRDNTLGAVTALALAALLGAAFAALVGPAMVRLSGLAAGIATFAVLGIVRNVLRNWTKIGPGAKAIPGVPTTGVVAAAAGLAAVVVAAWCYQRSGFGRRLRATREDAAAAASVGIRIQRERYVAWVVSGALAGFAGGLYVQFLGSVQVEQVYLDLTFLTLAMLVIGGLGSLWGALVGGLVVSLVNSLLQEAQSGLSVGGAEVTLPSGTREIVLALGMAAVLLVRPTGVTSGREFPGSS